MCAGADVCRRCELWEELAADAPLDGLRPCALCEEPWPPASLHPIPPGEDTEVGVR